eukprot:9137048-Pyramimonas_sp.AAC.1
MILEAPEPDPPPAIDHHAPRRACGVAAEFGEGRGVDVGGPLLRLALDGPLERQETAAPRPR